MLMKKTAKALVDEITKITTAANDKLASEIVLMQKGIDDNTVLHWMRWNALTYAHAVQLSREWNSILNGVTRMFNDEGQTIDAVLENLRGYRDGMVDRILKANQTNHSTGVLSNALEDEEYQVLREVAGANILGGDSLNGILLSCGLVK
jgi:hypothetical protein